MSRAAIVLVVFSLVVTQTGCSVALSLIGTRIETRELPPSTVNHKVVVRSAPIPAEVHQGDKSLGRTPLEVSIPQRKREQVREWSGCAFPIFGGLVDGAAAMIGGAYMQREGERTRQFIQIGGGVFAASAIAFGAWCLLNNERLPQEDLPSQATIALRANGYEPEFIHYKLPEQTPRKEELVWFVKPTVAVANVTAESSDFARYPQAPQRPNDYALVIGIERYRAPVPRAEGAERDARSFAAAVERLLGVPRRNVVSLIGTDATRSSIEARLGDWLPRNLSADSTLYVYFAGYGAPDTQTGNAFLMTWEADPSYIVRQGISVASVMGDLGKLPARRVVLMVDASFSGAGGRSVLPKGTRPLIAIQQPVPDATSPAKLVVFTAARSNEVTANTADNKHGLFSYFLLEGLKGSADGDRDGRIGFGELSKFVSDKVSDEAARSNRSQHPEVIGADVDFMLTGGEK